MEEDFVCHYFVDLKRTTISGPMSTKDDALSSINIKYQRSLKSTSSDNQWSPRMLTNFKHEHQAQQIMIVPSVT
jgi:hypothetical protein